MENNLSMLSEKQKEAYLLREQNLSFSKIAEKIGISPSSARGRYHAVLRRIQEYEHYNAVRERNNVPVTFPLTRGELQLIHEGLYLLTRSKPYLVYANVRLDPEEERKSYKRLLIDNMIERAEEVLDET